ncbi:Gfo/Idh/MocA family oxidoreductase [Amycolatopsis sp. EV170708-02-1]|uniref:Gfo/Idh/MocA family oxidoreductase n=1 Tax=Amycolatopsis sp. EV170708-02-1 TaxID=2919322 RepID=UPI001F0B7AB3|nr:Gfo/Idh/MocA family oxidoreductase [Amycolatopsis sp. EV170708-02-1]UMP06852.1 Gfo/Idh/MocA family oxidoreductase [Amycolatopsis sp. EV170708-02-1]
MTRVVVAGTAFGRIYLDAVAGSPDFTLAGVLARGGDYSRACAARYGVPLFESVDEVPDDVDVACVVVRSGALGGPGTELAQAFLRRGVHVLQEHPVHSGEISDNIRVARAGRAAYAVNTLYPNLRPVRRFLAAVEVLRSRQRLGFIDAACNSQVAYPLLDVLGRMTGGLRPWAFGEVHRGDRHPFSSLHAEIGGVPVTLRVQNQVHPGDPDNHSYLLHRISVGCEGGVLTLADTHGPVLWNPRLHSPRDETGRLVMAGPGTERLDVPSTVVLGDERPGTYHQVFAELWPDAVSESLRVLRRDAADRNRRTAAGQWALGVSRMWSDLTARIGMPELVEPPEPEPIPLADLVAMKEIA